MDHNFAFDAIETHIGPFFEAALHSAAAKIEVKETNNTAMDALDYVDHPDGFSVIAVGGDKLSRGLALKV